MVNDYRELAGNTSRKTSARHAGGRIEETGKTVVAVAVRYSPDNNMKSEHTISCIPIIGEQILL